MEARAKGYALLRGHGLEIGALHHPTVLPEQCTVDYCDAITKQQAIRLFPEVPAECIVDPTYLCDLDKGELQQFANEQFDFVILSHVIEHVANPVSTVGDLFRIVKPGGHVVLACPDKRYTFDKNRELTPLLHLVREFQDEVDHVTDDHYLDFLAGVHPDLLKLPDDELAVHLANVRSRREHAHVWDSNSFRAFIVATLSLFNENVTCMYESYGHENHLEYFSVWRRDPRVEVNKVKGVDDTVMHEVTRRLHDMEAVVSQQNERIAALESMIVQKNQHILHLEDLLHRIEAGRVLRLIRRLRQLRQ